MEFLGSFIKCYYRRSVDMKPKDVPGAYCSPGKARCQNLNVERQCICDSCEVWKEYDLKDADPNNHFC